MSERTWFDSLTDEQRDALAGMDESQMMSYLADEGIELPDEALKAVTGGINPAAAVFQFVRRYLQTHLGK